MKHKDNSTLKSCFRLMALIHSITKTYFAIVALKSIVDAAAPFVNIVYFSIIIDGLISNADAQVVLTNVAIMIFLNTGVSVVSTILGRLQAVKNVRINEVIKIKISEKTIEMDYDLLEQKSTLEYLERAHRGIYSSGGIQSLCGELSNIFRNCISLVTSISLCIGLFFVSTSESNGGLIHNFFASDLSTVLLVILMLVSIFVTYKISEKHKMLSKQYFEENVEANTKFGYFFGFMFRYPMGKDIRIYQINKLIYDELKKCNENIHEVEKRRVSATVRNSIKTIITNSFIEYLLYLFIGIKTLFGFLTIGELNFYIGALRQFTNSINGILFSWIQINVLCQYLSNFTDYLDIPNRIIVRKETSVLDKTVSDGFVLEFKNVSFSYPASDEMVLHDLSMTIRTGDRVALVGPNGAGKTTVVKLLCRLYDPTEGGIFLNGRNIKEYDFYEYTKLLSVVFQDFKLFAFPLDENIAVSKDINAEKLWNCLKLAGISDYVQKMPKAENTYLYNGQESGVEVSGGESQKLAIARSLYKDAPVVILDEPTSALDPIAEFEVYEKFKDMVVGKTSIFISHRMYSCKFCDRIYVFDNGVMIQCGSHNELVADEEGLYAEMWETQAQYYKK